MFLTRHFEIKRAAISFSNTLSLSVCDRYLFLKSRLLDRAFAIGIVSLHVIILFKYVERLNTFQEGTLFPGGGFNSALSENLDGTSLRPSTYSTEWGKLCLGEYLFPGGFLFSLLTNCWEYWTAGLQHRSWKQDLQKQLDEKIWVKIQKFKSKNVYLLETAYMQFLADGFFVR